MGRVAVAMLVAMCATPAVAVADSPLDWRFGGAAGVVFDSLGGADSDLTEIDGGGTGGLVAGRASMGFSDLPLLRVRADLGVVARRVDELAFYHLDVPVAAQVELPMGPVTPFASAGLELGWVMAGSYHRAGEFDEREDLDLDPLHVAALAAAGVAIPLGTVSWSAELRYSHGLRSIDPDSPGLDIRHRTWVVLTGVDW
jgi:hypothetical protein